MRILLDTHILLWAAGSPRELSPSARDFLENPVHSPVFSAASLWEITIKNSLGRTDFHVDAGLLRNGLLDNGYQELPITGDHVLMIGNLPAIHKDPFDRILIAQACAEGIVLLTADSQVAQYPGPIRMV